MPSRHKHITPYQAAIAAIILLFAYILSSYVLSVPFVYNNIERFSSLPVERHYTKCGKSAKIHNPSTTVALKRLNITYTTDPTKAILYLPCGYNNLESELAVLDPAHPQQVIFAVKGADQLCSKNRLWHRLQYYWGRDRASQVTPESWDVANKQDRAALSGLSSDDLANGIFILKKNIQRKRGLEMVRGMVAVDSALNSDHKWRVVQRYIKYPLCINKRKLNIRLYVCIVCPGNGKRPQWWLHQLGKCIYTASRYDPVSSNANPEALSDREQHFTSFNLDSTATYGPVSKGGAELPETLADLANHPTVGHTKWQKLWLDIVNAVSAIRKAYTATTNNMLSENHDDGRPTMCFIDTALKGHRCFQLFGMDVIVDTMPSSENKQYLETPWQPLILELNKGPEMSFKSPNDHIMKPQVMTDCMQLGVDNIQTRWQEIP